MLLQKDDLVLFIGDSVTDSGRNKENEGSRGFGDAMGFGYPLLVEGMFCSAYPELNVTFLNRGVCGNRSCDLVARWEKDCIALRPTVVSILIGVNDVWRRYDVNDPTSLEQFEENYRKILKRTKEELGARIVMMEPFIEHQTDERLSWHEDLDPKLQVIRRLAAEYADAYVATNGIMAAPFYSGKGHFTVDGVHPNTAGHGLLARAWIEAVGAKV